MFAFAFLKLKVLWEFQKCVIEKFQYNNNDKNISLICINKNHIIRTGPVIKYSMISIVIWGGAKGGGNGDMSFSCTEAAHQIGVPKIAGGGHAHFPAQFSGIPPPDRE